MLRRTSLVIVGTILSLIIVLTFFLRALAYGDFNALPFLFLLLVLLVAASFLAFKMPEDGRSTGLFWLAFGGGLAYVAYLTRFTMGIFLFPLAALLLFTGLYVLRPRRPQASQPAAERARLPLTRREREVLSLVAKGQSNQEIAGTLVISRNTVRVHVHQLLHKLDCSSREEAVRSAIQAGLLPSPDKE